MEVVIPERWKGRSVDLTPDMQPRLAWLNKQLCAAESWLDDCADWFKRLTATDVPNKLDFSGFSRDMQRHGHGGLHRPGDC
ncbi:hypothetical protein OS187_10170 [Xanthomonadaceae bacterium JHOS43]|nr:hypothetical protein [Xanthomonadaceae bacterium JHOS43]